MGFISIAKNPTHKREILIFRGLSQQTLNAETFFFTDAPHWS